MALPNWHTALLDITSWTISEMSSILSRKRNVPPPKTGGYEFQSIKIKSSTECDLKALVPHCALFFCLHFILPGKNIFNFRPEKNILFFENLFLSFWTYGKCAKYLKIRYFINSKCFTWPGFPLNLEKRWKVSVIIHSLIFIVGCSKFGNAHNGRGMG